MSGNEENNNTDNESTGPKMKVLACFRKDFPVQLVIDWLEDDNSVAVTLSSEDLVRRMPGFTADYSPIGIFNVLSHEGKKYNVEQFMVDGVVCVNVRREDVPSIDPYWVQQKFQEMEIDKWFLKIDLHDVMLDAILDIPGMNGVIMLDGSANAEELRSALTKAPHMVYFPGTDRWLVYKLGATVTDSRLCFLKHNDSQTPLDPTAMMRLRLRDTKAQNKIGHAFTIPALKAEDNPIRCVCATLRFAYFTFVRVGIEAPQGGFARALRPKDASNYIVAAIAKRVRPQVPATTPRPTLDQVMEEHQAMLDRMALEQGAG
jgi:hypothetical protein